ncbi:gelsolin-like protein 1 [Clytia hemisphaerica]|uniref:Gelsolin-like domain-containing protein n=1 Tax=Clytia hemisphaerica TaxID=252671 RepID=A0A7M5V818_9CNID
MQKAKQYDWKDSNMALFGSDTEKEVKKESAEQEKAWHGSGQKVGVEIWRINKFKIEKWPTEDYGKFYSGDSYIILNTYKDADEDELNYDLHFWIGKYSTQDEYGTAAYKTVELDTFHNDKPVQHREVQGHESSLFKTYFETITLMKGGAATGFRHVKPTEYKPRLFQVVGERKKIDVLEIPMKKGNVNSDDVFIFDLGLQIYQLNGSNANKDEKFRATQYVQKIKSERGGKAKLEVLEEGDTASDHEIFKSLKDGVSRNSVKRRAPPPPTQKGMYKLSDASGKLQFSTISTGSLNKSGLDTKDVFLVDGGSHLYVWVGNSASRAERQNGMVFATKFLQDKKNPLCPVTVMNEKKANKNQVFQALFA